MSIIYEPRAFWSVQSLRNDGLASRRPPLRLAFPREHFQNGERFHVTLTRLVLSPIGYPFEVPDFDTTSLPVSDATFRNGRGPVLERTRLSVAAAGRTYFNRETLPLQAYGAEEPTSEPERLDGTYANGSVTANAASTRLFNTFRWNFDVPLVLPSQGSVEFQLGTYAMIDNAFLISGTDPAVTASIAFFEATDGFWPAASRQVSRRPVRTAQGAVFSTPGFATASNVVQAWPGPDNAVLSSDAQLGATEFLRQQLGGHGAPTKLSGFAVALDQLTHDDEGMGPGVLSTARLASVGDRLNVRARNVAGGSQANWWRPDAPLSLVSPTMTTAKVYTLREAITLAPGDVLDVQLDLPEADEFSTEYQIGVSFCGFAAIQG